MWSAWTCPRKSRRVPMTVIEVEGEMSGGYWWVEGGERGRGELGAGSERAAVAWRWTCWTVVAVLRSQLELSEHLKPRLTSL